MKCIACGIVAKATEDILKTNCELYPDDTIAFLSNIYRVFEQEEPGCSYIKSGYRRPKTLANELSLISLMDSRGMRESAARDVKFKEVSKEIRKRLQDLKWIETARVLFKTLKNVGFFDTEG